MRRPNFLILDEPTNDLDIVTLGILEEYLCSFKGCVIVISHDRFFLDNIVDHLFVMQGDGVVKDFAGNYSEYRDYCAQLKAAEAPKQPASAAPEKAKQTLERKAKLTFKERKEFDALTEEIDALTAEKQSLEQIFNSGETVADIAEKSQRYNTINELLDEKEMRWLELSEKA
jgi:ATP-binding cassette subfamily F protein uup